MHLLGDNVYNSTLVITSDLSLWLKATEIVHAKSLKAVLILGGFHLIMSFLGSIGSVMTGSRSSYRRCSVKKYVLRNFAKFTRKHLCQSLFFNKVAGLRPVTFLKKETLAQVFSCEFCKIFKNTFFTKHLRTTASMAQEFLTG